LLALLLVVSPGGVHCRRALKGKHLDLHLARLDALASRVEALQ
jgi:hypothetical protein